MEDYAIEDAPQWIDRAFSADLLVSLYDYYGTLKHGFLNSVLGQKDCLETTDGYNYLASMTMCGCTPVLPRLPETSPMWDLC